MYYIIYKTTNTINGQYYIGCHQSLSLDDGYLGSGKYLRRAIKKYGKENFQFEILTFALSKEEMFELEKNIVTEDVVKDPLSYNLKIGGSGGNPGIVGAFANKSHSKKTKEKIRVKALQQITTEEKRKKCSVNNWAKKDPEKHREHISLLFKGKPKTNEHREKLRLSNLGKKHQIITCPHCGKKGGERAIKRWHFDNCKLYAPQA